MVASRNCRWDKLGRKCLITGTEGAPPLFIGYLEQIGENTRCKEMRNMGKFFLFLLGFWLERISHVKLRYGAIDNWIFFNLHLLFLNWLNLQISSAFVPLKIHSALYTTCLLSSINVVHTGQHADGGNPLLGGSRARRTWHQGRLGTHVAFLSILPPTISCFPNMIEPYEPKEFLQDTDRTLTPYDIRSWEHISSKR